MSEQAEIFNCLNDYWKQKRRSNTKISTEIILKKEISFISKNNGAHLIVLNRWDFWPSTGLFIDRKTKKRSRGVKNLLRFIKKEIDGL